MEKEAGIGAKRVDVDPQGIQGGDCLQQHEALRIGRAGVDLEAEMIQRQRILKFGVMRGEIGSVEQASQVLQAVHQPSA